MFHKVLLLLHMPCSIYVRVQGHSSHCSYKFFPHSFRQRVLRLFLEPHPPPPPPSVLFKFCKFSGPLPPPFDVGCVQIQITQLGWSNPVILIYCFSVPHSFLVLAEHFISQNFFMGTSYGIIMK
jgi:hypothetical protein